MEWLRQFASVPARRARDSREAAELREAAKKKVAPSACSFRCAREAQILLSRLLLASRLRVNHERAAREPMQVGGAIPSAPSASFARSARGRAATRRQCCRTGISF